MQKWWFKILLMKFSGHPITVMLSIVVSDGPPLGAPSQFDHQSLFSLLPDIVGKFWFVLFLLYSHCPGDQFPISVEWSSWFWNAGSCAYSESELGLPWRCWAYSESQLGLPWRCCAYSESELGLPWWWLRLFRIRAGSPLAMLHLFRIRAGSPLAMAVLIQNQSWVSLGDGEIDRTIRITHVK